MPSALFEAAPPPEMPEAPPSKLLCQIEPPPPDDTKELLRHRFLSRGGGMLLIGPTGAGKSSLAMQLSMLWALGREGFGIEPARPLRVLIIQAENDEHDMFDAMDGVRQGLQLTSAEWDQASRNVRVCHENSRSGPDFFTKVARPLLAQWGPDLFFIDPAFGYLGGENNQGNVSAFLRNSLNPLLSEFDCAAIINHHTNKPPSGEEKASWSDTDLAYAGAGPAEWANWARAVLTLRAKKQRGTFELVASKRGERLRWRNEADELIFRKAIRHSKQEGVICWKEMTREELAETEVTRRPLNEVGEEEVFGMLPEEGSVERKVFVDRLSQTGMSVRKAEFAVRRLVESGRAFLWKVRRLGARDAIHVSRHPQQG